MTFVVTEACIQCKYTDCVDVCPMECFYEGPNFLAIDPEGCIDCSICVGECPVNAIVGDREISQDQRQFIELNARLVKSPDFSPIKRSKAALPDADEWKSVAAKLHLLEPTS